jgi:peptide/nickel transport system substrate-binding protein
LRKILHLVLTAAFLLTLCACSRKPDPDTLVMIIESSPNSLDPRIGIDAQSERIDELIFDALVKRDEHFNLQPSLATSWDIPDPLTYVFHLRNRVRFHNGEPLTSRDVKWTFDSITNGTIRTAKASSYRFVDHIDAPDDVTVIFHLKEPWASLLWNVSDGAIGIVPYGSKSEMTAHPIGSGPFRFVSAAQDKDVIIERNPNYWGSQAHVQRVLFNVIPDPTTRALELRKGSADIAINALSADTIVTLRRDSALQIEQAPGTILGYMAFNTRDPILKDVRVRRAIAYAIDRQLLIRYLWRDQARPANSVLPPSSWAWNDNVQKYSYDPDRARQILDEAGYKPVNGIRFHITFKTSTEESPRLIAAAFQQQLREVGIALDIRTYEFATFLADVTKGAFQLYTLRWSGGNNDPDMFEYVFDSDHAPPKGQNRGFYSNPKLDALIAAGRKETDQQKRKEIYAQVQQILAEDLPYINLWYLDNVLVHTARVSNLPLNPAGNYDFLVSAQLQ